MECPDCGIELTDDNKIKQGKHAGICKQCYKRIETVRYLNKKNGTNNPYIPIKELKFIDIKQYRRVMGRRLSEQNKTKNKVKVDEPKRKRGRPRKIKEEVKHTEVKVDKPNSIDNIKLTYYTKVSKDLDKAFSNENINQDYLKLKDLPSWVDIFINLLDSNENTNYILQCKKGESIFNKMSTLYKHQKEKLDWNNVEAIKDIGYAEKALSELRRPTKDILDYYYIIDPIIEKLKENKDLIDLVNTAKLELDRKKEIHADSKFCSELESDFVDEDYIIKAPEKKNKLFDCTVWCYNYKGNPNKTLFRAIGGINAKNQVDAKLRFKHFLNTKFPSLVYSDTDISINLVNSKEEITKLIEMSCS